jgi:hypothetical protein
VDEDALQEVCKSDEIPEFTAKYASQEFRTQIIEAYPNIDHHQPQSDFDKYSSKEAPKETTGFDSEDEDSSKTQ